MIPARRLVLLVALSLLPATASLLLPWLAVWVAAWDGVLVLLLALEWWQRPRARLLNIERKSEALLTLGKPAELRLNFRWLGRRSLNFAFVDTPPDALCAPSPLHSLGPDRDPPYRQTHHLEPGAGLCARYPLHPNQRGSFEFGALSLRLGGRFGLAWYPAQRPLQTTLKVFPQLHTLKDTLGVLARARRGQAQLPRSGASLGDAFDSLREYQIGDDPRRLDARASARRGRPIVRQTRHEQHQIIHLFLDCGHSMRASLGDRSKLDCAIDAALSVGQFALSQGDQVGLLAFDHQLLGRLTAHAGPGQTRRLVEALSGLQASRGASDSGVAFTALARASSRRALLIIFSDFQAPRVASQLEARVRLLRGRHLPLVVGSTDTSLETAARELPSHPIDSYRRVLASRLLDERAITHRRLRAVGAQTLEAPADTLTLRTLDRYLQIKAHGTL